jgi:hypothetical protein
MTGKPMSWTLEERERELDRWEREMRAVPTVADQHYSPHTIGTHIGQAVHPLAGWRVAADRPERGGNADQIEPPRNQRPAVATLVRQGALTLKLGCFYRAPPSAARWR